jgi:hypothetical protein
MSPDRELFASYPTMMAPLKVPPYMEKVPDTPTAAELIPKADHVPAVYPPADK